MNGFRNYGSWCSLRMLSGSSLFDAMQFFIFFLVIFPYVILQYLSRSNITRSVLSSANEHIFLIFFSSGGVARNGNGRDVMWCV